jgi:uncharacterized glyoxalase superfamily protein PhnB
VPVDPHFVQKIVRWSREREARWRVSSRSTLLVVDDPERIVRQAVAAGATESSPVSNEHGWRLGRIIDPFGHEWEIGAPLGAGPPN